MKINHNVKFDVIDNFDRLTFTMQATAFNLADGMAMSTGDQLAGAILMPSKPFS